MRRMLVTVAYLATAALLGACSPAAPAESSKPSPIKAYRTSPPLPSAAPSPVPASASPDATSVATAEAAACAQRHLSSLSMTATVSQLFDVGIDVGAIDAGESIVRAGAGGVFLRGRSHAGLALAPAIARLQSVATAAGVVPPHVSADEEGGLVQSVSGPGIPEWPAAVDQGRWSTSDLRSKATAWADALKSLGLTLNLAPVADVVAQSAMSTNLPIGVPLRNYGTTPETVSERVSVISEALKSAGLASTVKHFPGLGRVTTNTDSAATTVDNITTVDDVNLLPFAAAVDSGVAAVMVSSARYPRIDSYQPAMFSHKIVTDLLRSKLHFRGLVLSDDLASAKAVASTPVNARAVNFLLAGGDMIVIVVAADFRPMVTAVLASAHGSPSMTARVKDAALHVLASKVDAGMLVCR